MAMHALVPLVETNDRELARVQRALHKAFEVRDTEAANAIYCLAAHVVDARLTSNMEHSFAIRLDSSLTQRAAALRVVYLSSRNDDSVTRATPAATARSRASKALIDQLVLHLPRVCRTNAAAVLLIRGAMHRHPQLESAHLVLHSPVDDAANTMQSLEIEANTAASAKRSACIKSLTDDDPSLDAANLPRVLKNRISAHASNAKRAAHARAVRRQFCAAILRTRQLALHAATMGAAILHPPRPSPERRQFAPPTAPVVKEQHALAHSYDDIPRDSGADVHAPIKPSEMAPAA